MQRESLLIDTDGLNLSLFLLYHGGAATLFVLHEACSSLMRKAGVVEWKKARREDQFQVIKRYFDK